MPMKTNKNPSTYNGIKDEDLKADVLRIIKEHNNTSLKCYEQYGKYSAGAISSHYGNWTNLLKELGIEPKIHMFTTPEEVLADIKRVFEETGNTGRANYERYGKYSRCIFTKHFGRSWNKIVSMLGYKVNMLKPGQYTKEDVLQDYQEQCNKENKLLTAAEYRKKGKFSQPIIDRLFGGFTGLRKALGLPYFIKEYTDEQICQILQEAYHKFGTLSCSIINHHTNINTATLTNRYGSAEAACQQFNIPYQSIGVGKDSSLSQIVEKAIQNTIGTQYVREQTFDWLIFKKNMFLDFYCPDINLAIEVDGPQHYEAIEYFGGNNALQLTQQRDKQKEKLLKQHNINLIRINEENIKDSEKIFQDYLALTKDQNASMTC